MRPLVVVITGATASGKTALAIEVARRFDTEIISADSRQIYRDIPIGTAAPSAEERGRAVHHLVGVLPLDASYSAARFSTEAGAILADILSRRSVAVVCGGAMLYIDALVRGLDDMPTVSEATRAYVQAIYRDHGLEGLMAQLRICDPEYSAVVDAANPRRVIHALELCLQAGRPYSQMRTGTAASRDFDVLKFAIDMPREQLFDRINRRVDRMMADGLEEEACRALALGDFNSLNTVGYKEMRAYFEGVFDRETAVARIAKNTRVYAKKQLTWLRRDPSVIWLSPENAFEEICRRVLSLPQG